MPLSNTSHVTSSPPPDDAEVFDLPGTLDRCDNDREFVQLILEEFLRRIPVSLGVLEASIQSGDSSAVHSAAHSLRGTLQMVGGVRAGALCMELETLSKGGELDTAPHLSTRIQAETALLKEAIEREVAHEADGAQTK